MKLRFIIAAMITGLVLITGCQGEDAEPPGAEPFEVPVSEDSGKPNLHVDEEGTLWMSWLEPAGDDAHALRYASFDGTQWSEPETVASGEEWFVNWADVPSLRTLPDGRLSAHFLVRSTSGPVVYAYDVHIAQTSTDGRWQNAITPHDDGTETEHGFVSMLPWEDNLLAVWLDGREMEGDGPMTLRSALLDPSGKVVEDFLLDDRVCECCPTSAVLTDEGALVAYRDRSEEEIRNIGLLQFDGEAWSEPYYLNDDGWRIEGCPVNGPSLAAEGNRVVAAWFTMGADNRPKVRAAFSEDGGRSFGDPILIDDNGPSGQVSAVLLDDGSALVSWYGRDGDENALLVRHVTAGGTTGEALTITKPMPSVRTGIPRMARSGGDLYFAWTDRQEDETMVRAAHARVNDLR